MQNSNIENSIREKWLELYQSGLSGIKIANMFGINNCVVYRYLKNHPDYKPRTTKETARLYEVDDNFFDTIDTEEKAYWLGFMYADGFVNTQRNVVGVTLHNRDIEHLVKFKKALKSTYPIKTYELKTSYTTKESYCCRLRVLSDKLKSDLIKNGCVENKSLILKFPDKTMVPDNLIWHFIRGYFDGDGSLTNWKGSRWNIKICGTYEFLDGIRNKLFECEIDKYIYKEKRNEKNNYTLNLACNLAIKITSKMYENSTIFLDRKFNKYNDMLEYYNSRLKK